MELREVIAFYKRNSWKIMAGALVFMLTAVGVYFLPPKYVASGSFVVVRNIEPLAADFSYEGYYAQLTSQDFSKNMISFFRNESVLDKVASNLQMDRTWLRKKIRVVKEAPSVSRLEVRHSSPDVAKTIWVALKDEVLGIVSMMNQRTDPGLEVFVIGDEPVVKSTYKNVYVFGVAGAMLGFLLSSLYLGLRDYLK
ncbi:MAG: hypothetical protein WC243_00635 [Patescibacteria group bacterium]|jgi:capsular polysaccharide biosynthesis protein